MHLNSLVDRVKTRQAGARHDRIHLCIWMSIPDSNIQRAEPPVYGTLDPACASNSVKANIEVLSLREHERCGTHRANRLLHRE